MSILDRIATTTNEALVRKKKEFPLTQLQERVHAKKTKRVTSQSLYNALIHPHEGDISIIAEVKCASPSAGSMCTHKRGIDKARQYEAAYVDAISVVTDEPYFKGSLALFDTIGQEVSLPRLRKDFVTDAYHVWESVYHDAEGLLLIARILSLHQLQEYAALCMAQGIEPVIEVYDTDDLAKALQTNVRCIGVNARDLQTFRVDIDTACRLMQEIPHDRLCIGFSGVQSRREVEQYIQAGARAVLVGTTLIMSDKPGEIIRGLKVHSF